ncbi:MAG: DoxX family membrane protein [Verrucomicrobiota bacterium]|nr:DoxX family membrane protein [Verrucomicrobiota bacterium]
MGIPFIWIGCDHFFRPEIFDPIVPNYLGFPRFWTIASGIVEILLGIGIMLPHSRRLAAIFLVVFLVLVYLANLNMWLNDIPFNGTLLSKNGHIIRLLVQLVLIYISLWLAHLIGTNIDSQQETEAK